MYGWRGFVEELARRPLLDQPARVEHAHPLAHAGDDPEVVADEEDRRVELRAQLLDQVEHLRLDRGVEPRGRLVQHEQVGIRRERHGEHDPLLLAARELMRVAAHHPIRCRDLHRREHLDGGGERLVSAHALVEAIHLRDLLADLDRRVEGRPRILVDHRHPVAAPLPKRRAGRREHVLVPEHDPARLHLGVVGQVAHERHRHRRLAAARLAHEAVGLAGADRERDVVEHAQQPAATPVGDREPFDPHGLLTLGGAHSSIARRNPSATRFTLTTSVARAAAGKSTIHQAIWR